MSRTVADVRSVFRHLIAGVMVIFLEFDWSTYLGLMLSVPTITQEHGVCD